MVKGIKGDFLGLVKSERVGRLWMHRRCFHTILSPPPPNPQALTLILCVPLVLYALLLLLLLLFLQFPRKRPCGRPGLCKFLQTPPRNSSSPSSLLLSGFPNAVKGSEGLTLMMLLYACMCMCVVCMCMYVCMRVLMGI